MNKLIVALVVESLVLVCFAIAFCDFGAVNSFGIWEKLIVAMVVNSCACLLCNSVLRFWWCQCFWGLGEVDCGFGSRKFGAYVYWIGVFMILGLGS